MLVAHSIIDYAKFKVARINSAATREKRPQARRTVDQSLRRLFGGSGGFQPGDHQFRIIGSIVSQERFVPHSHTRGWDKTFLDICMWRQMAHVVVAGSVALLMVIGQIITASAHTATLVTSDPAAGAIVAGDLAQVSAQFNEELDTHQSSLIVLDVGGHQVSSGDGQVDLDDPDHKILRAKFPSLLADGVYTVQWHLVLIDGDTDDGTFQFTVSAAAPSAFAAIPTTAPLPQPTTFTTTATLADAHPTPTNLDGQESQWLVWSVTSVVGIMLAGGLVYSWGRRRAS